MISDFNYSKKGFLILKSENSLREQTKNIPKGYGIYLFRRNDADGEILYIGKAGTIEQQGRFKEQKLRERINNKQDGMPRETYLKRKIVESDDLEQIYIEWYIIDSHTLLPGFIEAKLIQNFFAKHHRLPIWNKSF